MGVISYMSKLSKIRTLIMGLLLIIFAIFVIFSVIREFHFNDQSHKDKIYEQVREYLIDNNPVMEKDVEQAKTFVDIEQLGIKGKYKKSFVYVYALIKKYYIKDGRLVEGENIYMPYSFVYERGNITKQLKTKSLNDDDLTQIFPPSIYNQISYIDTFDESDINKQIEDYYSSFLSQQEYYKFTGDWHLKRATIKGKDVALSEIFGTGIQYGGKITLSKLGKYNEFLAISDTKDGSQGSYELKNDEITLKDSTGERKILKYNKKTKELSEQFDKDTILYFAKEE